MSDSEQTPSLVLRIKEIEDDPLSKTWSLSQAWLQRALSGTDAQPDQSGGQVSVNAFRQGKQFVVRGKVRVAVTLPCARSLDPAVYDLNPDLFLVLQQRAAADPSRSPRPKRERRRDRESAEADDEILNESDAAFEWFAGDEIALDTFVREQLVLELPMFPLRSDLRSDETPAIQPRSAREAQKGPAKTPGVDPRLLPLQAIAEKLKKS